MSAISSILTNSLNLAEAELVNPSSSSSASKLLIELRKQQKLQLQQIESIEFLPFQSINQNLKGSDFHNQIASSEICQNPKLMSIAQNTKHCQNNTPKHHVSAPISNAKKKKIAKGEAYKDRTLDKRNSKSIKKQKIMKMKNIY